ELNGRIGESVPLDRVGGPAIQEDRQIGRSRNFVGYTREFPVAIGTLSPLWLANFHLAESDFVAAQRPRPQPVLPSSRSAAKRKNPDSVSPSTRTISYGGIPRRESGRGASGES